MPHLLDASGNPLPHGRPSPRTGSTGVGIQKFGTQQLKFVAETPPKVGTPYQGVIEKDVGARTRLFLGGEATTPKTAFSQQYQQQRPATIRTHAQLETSPHAIAEGFGSFELPDLGLEFPEIKLPTLEDLFGENDEHGCECQACKDGTGQCSDKVPICDAWDIGCELTGGKVEQTFNWIKIILVLIGIGILLWVLRPLFGVAKNITGVSKSAVTRVNGMK